MVGEGRVIMSGKELRRVHALRQAMDKPITQVKASGLLQLTPRHIRCLIQRARAHRAWRPGKAHVGELEQEGKPASRAHGSIRGRCRRENGARLGQGCQGGT